MASEPFRRPQWLLDMDDPTVLPRALGLPLPQDSKDTVDPVKTQDAPVSGYVNRELRSEPTGRRPRLTLPVKPPADKKDDD